MIYHLARQTAWQTAQEHGVYRGQSDDREDEFLHFSTADQVRQSAQRHRSGESGLVLLRVDDGRLGSAPVWEIPRGGDLFPGLYSELPVSAVIAVTPLPLDDVLLIRCPDTIP